MTVPSVVRAYPSAGTQGADANTYTNASVDSTGLGANGAILVGFSYQAVAGTVAAGAVSSITFDGVALTPIVGFTVNAGSNTGGAGLYQLLAPNSGATKTFTMTMTGGTGTVRLTVNIVLLQDVASIGNSSTYNDGSGTTANQNATVTAATTALALAFGAHGDVITAAAVGSTLAGVVNNRATDSAAGCFAVVTKTGAGGATTLGFTSSLTDHWTIPAVELVGTSGSTDSAQIVQTPPPLLVPTGTPLRFPGPTAGPDPPALTADPQDASTIIVVGPPKLLLPTGIPLRFPGPGVDAASQAVSVSDTDTGTGSEGVPNIAFTATGDTGAGTEGTPGIAFTAPGDTGAGSEGTPGIGQSASETGAGTETATLTVALTVTETGTGTEGTPDIAFSAPETGAGTDAVSASSRASSASEAATGTDLVTDRAFTMADTGGGTDTGGVVTSGGGGTNIAGAETGKGTDKGTVQKGDRFTWLKARYSGLPSDL